MTILSLLIIFASITAIYSNMIDRPALFHKDEKMDKLVISNQIGYHFKRVVREVSQELFVSRRIDVSSLFNGIHVLKMTKKSLDKYCNSLQPNLSDVQRAGIPVESSGFVYIKTPKFATFAEAKARCSALNLQLPELYTLARVKEFSTFLKQNSITNVFAGIQPDPAEAIQRFIATGIPIWRTPHSHIINSDNRTIEQGNILDDLNVKFLYSSNDDIIVVWEVPSVASGARFPNHGYRTTQKDIPQYLMPIVCQSKWNGQTYNHFETATGAWSGFQLKSRYLRSVDHETVNAELANKFSTSKNSLKEYCDSVATQANEIHDDITLKLSNALSLVDISFQLENGQVKQRNRRSAFLASFVFTTGVRLIWSLFGIIQRMRLNQKVDRLETGLSLAQGQLDVNSKSINNMSMIIYGHSIAIDQLKIATRDLDNRITQVEKRVAIMEQSINAALTKIEVILSLSLVVNLILRIQQSINTGYDTLEDIIHCSLLGQTSPLLLPIDQIQLVQTEVQKVSASTLDTDFAKMQSIIVSDPTDPHLLLVVINMAALNRKTVELIKLVPIPYYVGTKTYSPILDYDTIILDQLSRTYSILSEQEEYDCLFNRCYISDIERSINDKTCGTPQMFNQHLDMCVSEELTTTGVFLKPMLPDGVLFSVNKEVTTQLFCKDGTIIGPMRKLNGTGIMHLPNGCTLSVTDDQGRTTKVKGQPLYRMIDAQDLNLSMNGPLSGFQTSNSPNYTHKFTMIGNALDDHLSSMMQQVRIVDTKVKDQHTSIWIITGSVIFIILLITVMAIIAYQHRSKFYRKIHVIRRRFDELHQILYRIRGRPNRELRPPVIPQPMGQIPATAPRNPYGTIPRSTTCDKGRQPHYISLCELEETFEGKSTLPMRKEFSSDQPDIHRYYPNITPFMDELSSKLATESDEVEQLCKNKLSSENLAKP
jgi:hypothetical protein